ncbi:MAG: SDR family NAD(P)-dependent oxidoreductase [Acidimicrobiales bacterium]
MEQLSGKVAVITGGASGIGLALGHAFAAEQMNVVLADIERDALERTGAELAATGATVHTVVCDVSDPVAVDQLRNESLEVFGAVHVVCNNAGVGGGGPSWEVPLATWHWVFGVNFWGVVHGISSFVPLLLEQGEGHIVNTASAAGLVTMPYMGPYSATKHAVVALTESLSMELGLTGRDVKASVLCPMWVRTRIHESERNAPSEVRETSAPLGATDLGGLVAGLVAGGLEPQIVAGEVVQAVREGRFYVLPHNEVRAGVLARARRITAGESPVFELPS